MRQERLARLVLGLVLALAALIVGWGWYSRQNTSTLRARMPEQGGWLPGEIQAVVGQPLHLRLTSDDVLHSFAVGQLDLPPVDIHPGEVAEVSLNFDRPGKYTYYCTRWCGPNHWRMRGTIEVSGGESIPNEQANGNDPPLYAQLGLDIDASHLARVTPAVKPAAGSTPVQELVPPAYRNLAYYTTHSPVEAWEVLRFDSITRGLSDQQVWSLVAGLWQSHTNEQRLSIGKRLYDQNCAACHGEAGAGDGVFAEGSAPDVQPADRDAGVMELASPTDFTNAGNMLGASPALLQGKILRGGMGTGMPYWGPIFTEEEIWALVDYLWTFQFDYELEDNP